MENGKLKMEPYAEMEIKASVKDGTLSVQIETCGNAQGYIECLRKIVGDMAKALGQRDRRRQSAFEKHLLMALTMDSMERVINDGRSEN